MRLYHFSEEPNIKVFEPRPPLAHPDTPARVWAIDEWHSPVYFFPRDCPRVCWWALPTSSSEDVGEWLGQAKIAIAIEEGWLERVRVSTIYRYELPAESFIDCHDHGVHVNREAVVPVKVEPLAPLGALAERGVDLRVLPELGPLAKSLMVTTLHWSLIRMVNAVGWDLPAGSPVVELDN